MLKTKVKKKSPKSSGKPETASYYLRKAKNIHFKKNDSIKMFSDKQLKYTNRFVINNARSYFQAVE